MDTKQKIEILEQTLDDLNKLTVTGLRACGTIYVSACNLERLLHVLRAENAEERAVCEDQEQEEDNA